MVTNINEYFWVQVFVQSLHIVCTIFTKTNYNKGIQ